ncbi:MFS transporter, partial [Ottowia sp.]|uniref:MFS transporter n=1 Tax=Ottowia sp. TaxID=1898956 RepID=UPI0039E2C504
MTGRELTRLVLAQVCVHSAMTGSRLVAPLLALKLGYSAAEVGVLLALFALSPVFLALPAGRLADRHGLHLPLALAVGTATLGAGLAAVWPVYGVLCLGGVLTGAASGTAQIALQRHVGRSAGNATELKTVFSWLAIAPALANFLGPLLAGLLIDHAGAQPADMTGFRAAYTLLAALPIVCWLLALFALSPVFLALPAGRLADRHGLHLPLALAVGTATLGAGLAAIWPVYGVLCLGGVLTGAASGTAQIALQRHVGRSAGNATELKAVFSWLAIA